LENNLIPKKMKKIENFRQPIVTATGILLGFALSVAGAWVPQAFQTNRVSETILAIGLFVYVPLYITVLYRILSMDYPVDTVESYYRKTLFIFLTANVIFYLSIIAVMIESLFIHK
jgi:hypothetical protein